MANELKPNKGVVVTEINGIKYFKLQSPYPGDYTKNCGLLGNEIDENFFFLRSNDIENITVEDGILTLTRVDGDTLKADVSTKCDFQYNKDTGELTVTNEKGEVQVIGGFFVENDFFVATNETLDGDGTNYNPLRLSETERTGTYSPAKKFIDMAVYDYYVKVSEVLEEEEVYFYREIDKENIPHGVIIVDLPEKPTEVTAHSPEYIRVKQNINLPDAANLGKGYRIVTRETLDKFGLLYDFEGVTKIKETLESKGSLWRIPTREDWAEMLNAAEYCDEDRTHDEGCINEWKGKNAGSRAKSVNLWKPSSKTESGLPVSGEDNLPKFGTNTFRVYPVGYGDGSRGAHDIDHDIEAFGKRASFWTDTIDGDASCNSNVYTVTFGYDTRKVLQESSKPSSRMSIRLVKDYESDEMNISEIENILGYNVPCVFISNPDTKYSKIWTAINIGFKEPQFSGMTSYQWSVVPSANKGEEIVYYVNEWDGLRWIKKQMYEGDSIVILDGGLDESGQTIYNHEWRIYSGETEPVLVDTAEALKEEFQKEIDEINERVDELSATTESMQEEIDSIQIVSATPNSTTVLMSYMLNVNGEQRGVTIDIPKDKAIKEIRLGHMGATVDENTGVITDGPEENSEALLIVYHNEEGKYNLVQINLEDFIQENEFASGVTVTDHIVHGVVDPLSDSFLTVGADGFKLAGVQDEINRLDEKIEAETERAIAAEESISGTVDTFSAATVSEIARLDEKIDTEIARAEAEEERLDKKIDTFSAATVEEITRLDNKIDAETARAEAEEEKLNGQDIANSDSYEMSIDGLTLNRNNGETIHIELNGDFGNNMPLAL